MDSVAAIFKAYDVRGKVKTELTPDVAERIGRAFAEWLPERGTVVVGRDMRESSEGLAAAVIKGLTEQGRDVWDVGLVTSDMVYFAPGKYGLAGGVMITASHNPSDYNGLKFCREQALPVGIETGLGDIRDRVLSDEDFTPAANTGSVTQKDILDDWIEQVLSFVDVEKLQNFHIAVDAGNGMTGMTVPAIAEKLPLKIEKLYFDLDGTFPNHEANPMKEETLRDISAKIKDKKLDFGIAFDGDGDRMALIDDTGAPLSGSVTCALLSEYVLKKYPGATIVHDLRMSRGTIDHIKNMGGRTVRTKVGNTFLKEIGRREAAKFGGEITGHFMFADNYFVDSGLLAAMIAIEVLSTGGYKLSEFVAKHDIYAHRPEIMIEVGNKDAVIKHIAQTYEKRADLDWLDGLTVSFPYGWFNIRPSNTEPVLKLNAEAENQDQLNEMIARVMELTLE